MQKKDSEIEVKCMCCDLKRYVESHKCTVICQSQGKSKQHRVWCCGHCRIGRSTSPEERHKQLLEA